MAVSRRQVITTIIGLIVGALPGIIWYAMAGVGQALVIAILGAFVAAALTLPGVSARRVAGGTVGMIATYNTPRVMHGAIWDVTLGKDKPKPADEPSADPENA